MKLTKSYIKSLILEELDPDDPQAGEEEFEFGKSKEKGSVARQKGIETAKAQTGGGVDDQERAIITQLSQALTAAAKKTSLKSGNIKRYSELLYQALKDILEK
tara:strand:+ start:1334 stop:1642 length:309 start_codon:yes stop_codon:yes gene_type:complete